MNPYEIIKKSVYNMNSHPATKYKHVPDDVEKNNFSSGVSRG